MARKLKKIPSFKNEDQERKFWDTHDSTDYIDWSKGETTTIAELKPSVKTISIRLPEALLEAMKNLANSRDVPYQSLMKIFLADRIRLERMNKTDNKKSQRAQKLRRKA